MICVDGWIGLDWKVGVVVFGCVFVCVFGLYVVCWFFWSVWIGDILFFWWVWGSFWFWCVICLDWICWWRNYVVGIVLIGWWEKLLVVFCCFFGWVVWFGFVFVWFCGLWCVVFGVVGLGVFWLVIWSGWMGFYICLLFLVFWLCNGGGWWWWYLDWLVCWVGGNLWFVCGCFWLVCRIWWSWNVWCKNSEICCWCEKDVFCVGLVVGVWWFCLVFWGL